MEPVRGVWDDAQTGLRSASHGGGARGVLVLGAANSGKTRFALEALRAALPELTVLAWRPDYGVEHIPPPTALQGRDLVVLVDDVQLYALPVSPGHMSELDLVMANATPAAMALGTLLQRVRGVASRVVVVATCRTEDERATRAALPWLFHELTCLALPTFSPDPSNAESKAILAEFAASDAPHIADWDGTVGSVVLGLGDKQSQYLSLRNQLAGMILRAMKLLSLALTAAHTERRLQAIVAEVYGAREAQTNPGLWDAAVETLIDQQLVSEARSGETGETELRIRKDTYFEKVVSDYPGRDTLLDRHLDTLRATFRNLGDASGLSNLGVTLSGRRGYHVALDVYDEALALDPCAEAALQNKANALYFLGRGEEALQPSDRALALGDLNAVGWTNRGVLLAEVGRKEEALAAFDRALDLDPTVAIAAINKGTLLSSMKRNAEALANFERAQPLEPENETLLCNLGVVRMRLRNLSGARQAFEDALRIDPTSTMVKVNLAAVLAQLGEIEVAQSVLDDIADDDPVAVQAWHNRGTILAQQKRPKEALEAYDRALALNPRHAVSLACKAGALNELGRYPDALVACEEARSIDPDCVDAWRNMGAAYCAARLPERAIVPLDIALHLDPDDEATWYYKGVAHLNLKQYDEALCALERALELNPTNADALRATHQILALLNKGAS